MSGNWWRLKAGEHRGLPHWPKSRRSPAERASLSAGFHQKVDMSHVWAGPSVKSAMEQNPVTESRWVHASISVGVGLFILALTLSAVYIPQLRVLHVFQALIYVAVIVLTRRNSAWGYGVGVIIAVFWNGFNLFVTHLFEAGAGQLWSLLRTGHVSRPDTLMVLVGGVAHFWLIIACMAGFLRLRPDMKHWGQFLAGGLLALAYFILIVVTTAPH
jgi:hypothetical protein